MLGAEAEVIRGNYNGNECAIKKRIPKTYRHPQIDKIISTQRSSNEVKILNRLLSAGIDVPKVYYFMKESHTIYMEWVCGTLCKDFIENSPISILVEFASLLATTIANIHKNNVIHGDLTTCNIIIRRVSDDDSLPLSKQISPCVIDFGLSYNSTSIEDKAVDLYVLEKCIRCSLDTHFDEWYNAFLIQYTQSYDKGYEIIKRLNQVRLRGRKRSMAG